MAAVPLPDGGGAGLALLPLDLTPGLAGLPRHLADRGAA